MKIEIRTIVERMRALARLGSPQVVRDELENVRAEDIAEGLLRVSIEDGLEIIRSLDDEKVAFVLVELPTETAKQYLRELPDPIVAKYLDILPMDDALELREDIGDDRFDRLLGDIPTEDAQEINRLLAFPEDSIGRSMTEDYVEVSPDDTMEQIIDHIRRAEPGEYETVNDIYVLDVGRKLVGVFSLRQAIQADSSTQARQVMITDLVTCLYDAPAEEVARSIARYGFYAMPVVDREGRMLGIFTVDDAQRVLSEADTEDVLKLGGVGGNAEPYLSLGIWQIAKRRIPWLMVLFFAQTLTGAVMRYYGRGESGQKIGLPDITYFIPLLIGAGGNSGSQTTTTVTRALAVGDVTPKDALAVLRREFAIALLVGVVLGVVGFFNAKWWGTSAELSLAVGLALPLIIIWATAVGSVLPLGAKALRIDPAVMSAPFISTLVDASGLIIYFELVRRLLS